MMRSRRDIFESTKIQWIKHLELLSLKITELTIEPATHEALMNDVKVIHQAISDCDGTSPLLYKKINDALDKLEGEIILLSLPVPTPGQQTDMEQNAFLGQRNQSSAGIWSFFCCCQSPDVDEDTFEPKKLSSRGM